MRYRRANVKGGTYFFTVNLADRNRSLLVDSIDALRNAVSHVMNSRPFTLDAIVVLPDHLHALWTLPDGDRDFATRWMLIKAAFSRQLPKEEYRALNRKKKSERGIWQRRYWEHCIRDEGDYNRHVEYIHYNPVKHGHVACAADWGFSSIHRFIANGVIEQNWGVGLESFDNMAFGEKG